jgi:hypothetical protein
MPDRWCERLGHTPVRFLSAKIDSSRSVGIAIICSNRSLFFFLLSLVRVSVEDLMKNSVAAIHMTGTVKYSC